MTDLHTVTGIDIPYEEYLLALPDALSKFQHINTLTGSDHGKEYLDLLIIEAVKANRLSRFLDSTNKLRVSTITQPS